MYRKLGVIVMTLAAVTIPAAASAHVVVKPAQVGIGEFQTFQTGVPNEKDQPSTALKIIIPAGLNYVAPNVKPGWDIKIVKNGDKVTEIDWTGGSIPAGQRDEFDFSAQAPASPTDLHWKAYQTYADGTVVAWDQTPTGKKDDGSTPYSITKVVNDLAATHAGTAATTSSNNANLSLGLSIVALVVSVGGVLIRRKR